MLFSTIAQIREYVAINVGNEFNAIKPYIKQAETKFIKPIIGKDVYDSLNDYLQASDQTTAIMNELVEKVRLPLIYYAYYLYAPIGNVQVSSSGIHIVTNENKKTAFEWQIDKLETSWLNTAHDFIEDLLEFLDENQSDIDGWKDSVEYTKAHSLFILSAKQFNEYVFINQSRRLYTAMVGIIADIERKYILPQIGADMFNALKTEMQASDGPSPANQTLIDKIASCVAKYTMARTVKEFSIEIIPQGLFEKVVQVSMNAKQSASADKISMYTNELTDNARGELKGIQEFLDEKATSEVYAEYFNSDLYIAPSVDNPNRGEFVNASTKGLFVA
jgi:hypothetical protein